MFRLGYYDTTKQGNGLSFFVWHQYSHPIWQSSIFALNLPLLGIMRRISADVSPAIRPLWMHIFLRKKWTIPWTVLIQNWQIFWALQRPRNRFFPIWVCKLAQSWILGAATPNIIYCARDGACAPPISIGSLGECLELENYPFLGAAAPNKFFLLIRGITIAEKQRRRCSA